jgi:hypothetical protein
VVIRKFPPGGKVLSSHLYTCTKQARGSSHGQTAAE